MADAAGTERRGAGEAREEGKQKCMRGCLTRESRLAMANSIVRLAVIPGLNPVLE
jgi:hypothetical protein